MDEFTKRKVKRVMIDNPDLPVKFVISAIKALRERKSSVKRTKQAR